MNKPRFPVFDWMRSIAIFIILIHHLPDYTLRIYDLNNFGIPLDLSRASSLNAHLGLGLFVFISGYLINSKKAIFRDLQEIKLFLQLKFVRIFILYYFACIYFFVFINDGSYGLIEIAIHVSGLQLLAKSANMPPMATIWFVGLIVVYYAVFVILKSTFLNRSVRISFFICVPILFFLLDRSFDLTDERLFLYYPTFFAGVFCVEFDLPKRQLWQRTSMVANVLFIAAILCFFANFQYFSAAQEGLNFLLRCLLLNVLTIAFAMSAYNLCQWLSKSVAGFNIRIQSFAYASYCMYLFHRPIFHLLETVNEVIAAQFPSGYGDLSQLLLMVVVGFPLVFGLSYLGQSAYDNLLRPKLLQLVY